MSFKELKKQISKMDSVAFDDLKLDIFQVLDQYLISDLINDLIYMELLNFVNVLIYESDVILNEINNSKF